MGVVVRLRKGRERAVERSPWIFSGAVESTEGRGEAGDAADVVDWEGRWVGRGWWNPAAELRVRVLTRREGEALDEAWVRARVRQAAGMRTRLFGRREEWGETSGWRMVFSEADGLSGLVADQYDGTLLVEVGAKGWERWAGVVADELKAAAGAERAVIRAAEEAVKREGVSASLAGDAAGVVRFRENGWTFEADLGAGQKTGFYLDQRDNRRIVAGLAAGLWMSFLCASIAVAPPGSGMRMLYRDAFRSLRNGWGRAFFVQRPVLYVHRYEPVGYTGQPVGVAL